MAALRLLAARTQQAIWGLASKEGLDPIQSNPLQIRISIGRIKRRKVLRQSGTRRIFHRGGSYDSIGESLTLLIPAAQIDCPFYSVLY